MKIYIRGKQLIVEDFVKYIRKSIKHIKATIITDSPEYEVEIVSNYDDDYCLENAIALFPNVKVRGCVVGDRDSVNEIAYLNQIYSEYGSHVMQYNILKRKKIIDTYEEKVESYNWWDKIVTDETETIDENACLYEYKMRAVSGGMVVDLLRYIGTSDKVFIPKTISGNKVSRLEKNLFKDKVIKSVEFEKGFSGVIINAFDSCSDIEELIFDVEDLKEVNICKIFKNSPALFPDNCFIKEHKLLGVSINYTGDFIIDDSYTAIGPRSFDGCKKIKKVSFEEKWKNIELSGDFRFKLLDARKIESLTIWGGGGGCIIEELLLSDELLRLRIEHVKVYKMILPEHMHYAWEKADGNYYCRLTYPRFFDTKKNENKQYKVYLPNIPYEKLDKEYVYAFLSSKELHANADIYDEYIKKNGKAFIVALFEIPNTFFINQAIRYGYINKKNVEKYLKYLNTSYAVKEFTNPDNPNYKLLRQVVSD